MSRNGRSARASWIGLWLLGAISAGGCVGWMFARAEAANPPSEPPARSAATSALVVPDVGNGSGKSSSDSVVPSDVAPSDHGSGVREGNIAPAKTSGDEESLSGSHAKAVASVDGLTLLRQSLRRGGLGSKALMTLTIRNSNDYPVKHIELACAFRSRDGRYVTERRHMIDGIVKPNSRKTFQHMMVGFVSVNASRAKCALLSADWA
ncbi:MAG: hypothetical protein JSS22_02695 [Proteobacteria bacterium]|nr:hypothetical protein [Pseudomonadota bacterium]